jgi:hypothetical protein
MSRRSLVVLLLLACVSPILLPSPAAADCSGPTIQAIHPAVRGDVITVKGYGFGDNCYDTGPPPAGQGALGIPVGDLELLVSQGDKEVQVASGRADDDYEFSVDVVVPSDLAPGSAWLVARWGADRSTVRAFDVLADPPVAHTTGTTSIGPIGSVPASTAEAINSSVTESAVASVDDGQSLSGARVGAALLLVLAATVAAVSWTRRSRRREPG